MIKQAWNYKSLVAEGSSNSSGGGSDGAFTYKSRKVVWKVDNNLDTNDDLQSLLSIFQYVPIYCVSNSVEKYYGNSANGKIGHNVYTLEYNNCDIAYIEECEVNCKLKINNYEFDYNGSLIDFVKQTSIVMYPDETNITDDMIIELMNSAGLSQIPYEEYINIDVDAEFGCLTLKN